MEITIHVDAVGFVLIAILFTIIFYKIRSDRKPSVKYPQVVKKKDKQPTLF